MTTCECQVGVAFSDAALRRLGACEFADDEHFCNLEAVTTQLGAKECVMPKARCLHFRSPAIASHLCGLPWQIGRSPASSYRKFLSRITPTCCV